MAETALPSVPSSCLSTIPLSSHQFLYPLELALGSYIPQKSCSLGILLHEFFTKVFYTQKNSLSGFHLLSKHPFLPALWVCSIYPPIWQFIIQTMWFLFKKKTWTIQKIKRKWWKEKQSFIISSLITITVQVSHKDFASNHCNQTVNIIYHLSYKGQSVFSWAFFHIHPKEWFEKKINSQLLEYTVLINHHWITAPKTGHKGLFQTSCYYK